MLKHRSIVLLATVVMAAMVLTGCNKTTPPNTPAVPSGSSSGSLGITYSFFT